MKYIFTSVRFLNNEQSMLSGQTPMTPVVYGMVVRFIAMSIIKSQVIDNNVIALSDQHNHYCQHKDINLPTLSISVFFP